MINITALPEMTYTRGDSMRVSCLSGSVQDTVKDVLMRRSAMRLDAKCSCYVKVYERAPRASSI